jgi:DNA ligase-1
MQRFTELYTAIEQTNRTSEKVALLEAYFRATPPEDAAWALHFLTGRSRVRAISGPALRTWVAEETSLPQWLVEESYEAVGDLAETLALLTDRTHSGEPSALPLHRIVAERYLPLRGMAEAEQRALVTQTWAELSTPQRLVWHKLITGGFRVGVGKTLVVRALAAASGIPAPEMAHRLMGEWQPTAEAFLHLTAADAAPAARSRPYPFYLAYQLDDEPDTLGNIGDWQIEWKWDGIRAQVIHRGDDTLVWTRGEELVTDVYPEIEAIAAALPSGTVLDGEILTWQDDKPLSFALLQQRIGRKKVDAKVLKTAPVILMAYDLLEWQGEDLRPQPLTARRARLAELAAALPNAPALRLSPIVEVAGWQEAAQLREESRARGAEGFMLKRRDAPYGVGRKKGDWWKWKVDPYSVDAVLTYAQPGHGKRAGLFTDYTFGLWNSATGELNTIAKAYSGLTDAEIAEVDAFVRRNTTERFGPVRGVKPELVFELGFEGIQRSTRHKAGYAVRFPRMLRWRRDKRPEEADTLDALEALIGD